MSRETTSSFMLNRMLVVRALLGPAALDATVTVPFLLRMGERVSPKSLLTWWYLLRSALLMYSPTVSNASLPRVRLTTFLVALEEAWGRSEQG